MIYFYLLGLIIVIYGASVDTRYPERKKKYIIVVSSLLIIVSGLRNIYWGPDDTYNYYKLFEKVKGLDYNIIPIVQIKDPFYSIFTKFAGSILFGSYRLYLLFLAFIYVGSFSYLVYKYSPNVILSYLIFIALLYTSSMVIVRQSLAISILIFSYKYLLSRKFFKFSLLVIIAAMFHKTALIFFIIYPLSKFKINILIISLYTFLCVLAIVYGQTIINMIPFELLDDRLERYMIKSNTLTWAGFIQLVLFAILTLFYKKQATLKYPQIHILYHLLFISIIFQTGTAIIDEIFRIALYFKVFLVILVPQVLMSIRINRKVIINTLSALLLLYYFLSNLTQDYVFFWESYEPKFILT